MSRGGNRNLLVEESCVVRGGRRGFRQGSEWDPKTGCPVATDTHVSGEGDWCAIDPSRRSSTGRAASTDYSTRVTDLITRP